MTTPPDPLDRPWHKTGDGWQILATIHKCDSKTAEVVAKAIALCIGEREIVMGVAPCDHADEVGVMILPPIHHWSLPNHKTTPPNNPEGK